MNRRQRRAAGAQHQTSASGTPVDAGASHVAGLLQRGVAHQRAGRFSDAADRCLQVLTSVPHHAAALHLLGIAYAALGRHAAAAEALAAAIRENADDPACFNNFGNVLTALGRLDEAVASFDRALALRPDYAEAHANLGIALRHLGRLEEALSRLDRAVALRPDYAEAHCNRGSVLTTMNRLEEAVASLDRAIALRPDYATAHSNRGNALAHLRRLQAAAASYRHALALRPDHAEVLSNLAAVLTDLGQLEQALDCADRAIAVNPDQAGAHCNRATALSHGNRVEEAAASYDRALALQPDSADFARNKAHLALLMGDYPEGWRLLERRWQARGFTSPDRRFAQPLWRGEALDGRVLLLHAEQGYGDSLQFCRYAPMAAAHGRVFVEVPRPLLRLLSGLPGIAGVIPSGDTLPQFDLHCPFLSLPGAFRTELHAIPAPAGYLHADPALQAQWALRAADAPRVGLVWSGRPSHRDDGNRSLPLAALLPLLDCGAALHALQPAIRAADRQVLEAEPRIDPVGLGFADFADTAAVVAQLDLVISVDTSVAHLAAALGKPTWVLLAFAPDWRWLLDREDSPWYPTVRLFRQPARGDWASVIRRVGDELRAFTASWRAVTPRRDSADRGRPPR
jgi:tetratricopeptide (TPR) repeat protein